MKPLFWTILLFTTTVFAQSGNSLDQVFAKMDQASRTFRSIEANIERTHVTVLVDDKDVSYGKFYYVRSGKDPRVKLELLKPNAEFVLIDAGKLQHYMPKVNQVQEKALGTIRNQVEMFMALGFGQSSQELKSNFDVTLIGEEAIDGQKTIVLDLKPKSGSMFKSVRMWMDPQKWISLQTKITESSNDYMIMKFTNAKLNAGIPNSRFKLNMPKNVKVIKL